jgi:hypothetical protein
MRAWWFGVVTARVITYRAHHVHIIDQVADYQMTNQRLDARTLTARVVYEHVLRSIVEALSPDTPFVRESIYGGKGPDTAVGDVHQRCIWVGRGAVWREYDRMGGRLIRFVNSG